MQGGLKTDKIIYPELSYKIIGILFEVSNIIGPGFKEKHFQRAIEVAFNKYKIRFLRECPFRLRYHGKIIGRYYMDFVVEDRIVLEIKRGDYFSRQNIHQLKGYLEATGLKLGILANFTSSGLRYKRIINLY